MPMPPEQVNTTKHAPRMTKVIEWTPPDSPFVTLNTAGSALGIPFPGLAWGGGVLRNWLKKFDTEAFH